MLLTESEGLYSYVYSLYANMWTTACVNNKLTLKESRVRYTDILFHNRVQSD